ncbi:hypothetical protein B0H13DRAFT_1938198 [Mycena leptocephala]|nr:hypothetical protein B0H13DRAFT_1938198 [Mycena leptocephala]
MGESPVWTVLTGTVIISLASTCITGLYATFSGKTLKSPQNHQNLAAASAFNSAITAATFFTIREYVVSPTIRAAVNHSPQQRGSIDNNINVASDNLSWSGLRKHNLLDSGVSGAATGGILRGLTAGRRTIGPAAITAGMACVLLQAAYNELGIQRIKYVSKLSQQRETSAALPETPVKPSLSTRILGTLGVRILSDEELLIKFRREREKHLKKIEQLERELEADREQNGEK